MTRQWRMVRWWMTWQDNDARSDDEQFQFNHAMPVLVCVVYLIKLMADGPSFLCEKLLWESWYKNSDTSRIQNHLSFSYEKHGEWQRRWRISNFNFSGDHSIANKTAKQTKKTKRLITTNNKKCKEKQNGPIAPQHFNHVTLSFFYRLEQHSNSSKFLVREKTRMRTYDTETNFL